MGVGKGIQRLENLVLGQNHTSQAASYQNHNLLMSIIPNHFKSTSGIFGPLNRFLIPKPDYRDLLSVAKSFLYFGPKTIGPKTLGCKSLMNLLNLKFYLLIKDPKFYFPMAYHNLISCMAYQF